MFGKKSNDNGEKLYRYSIRKYHFGAASVAVAALMFFANGAVKADTLAVSPVTANTEKVNAGVTGLTEGVPPKENLIEKSKEVEGDKTTVAQKPVDKSPLVQAISELQAAIAKADEESLLSLANQLSQLTDENKRLLDGKDISEETLTSQVIRVQSLTEQVRQLKSKTEDKTSNKEDKTDSKAQNTKELKVSDKAVIPTNQNEEIKAVQKDENKEEGAANKDKLESLSKSLITYLDTAKKIERPETKKLLEGVEEIVRSVENGLVNPKLTASEIEELMKRGKQAEQKLVLAVTREHSGKRDSRNGQSMESGTSNRAAAVSQTWTSEKNILIYQRFRASDFDGHLQNGNRQFTENKVDMTARFETSNGSKYVVYDVFFNNDGRAMGGSTRQVFYKLILQPEILDLKPDGTYKGDTLKDLKFEIYQKNGNSGTLSQNPGNFYKKKTVNFNFLTEDSTTREGLTYKNTLDIRHTGDSYGLDMRDTFKSNNNDPFLAMAVQRNGVYSQWSYGFGVLTLNDSDAVHMQVKAKLKQGVTEEKVREAYTLAVAGTQRPTTNQSYVFVSGRNARENYTNVPDNPVVPTVKQSEEYQIKGKEVTKTVGESIENVSNPVSSGFVVRNNDSTTFPSDVRWSWTNGRQPNTNTAGVFQYNVTANYYDNSSNSANVTLKVKPKKPIINASDVEHKKGLAGQSIRVDVGSGVKDNSKVKLYDRGKLIGEGRTTDTTATVIVSEALSGNPITAETIVEQGGTVTSERSEAVTPTEIPDKVAPTVLLNGNRLTTNENDNRFIIYRGAAFNPTFNVTDESRIGSLMVRNLPKGVYFNKVNNVDKELVGTSTTLNHTISDDDSNKVADDATLGEQIALVEASDQYGNSATYKFKYRIVDIQAKNSTTENRAVGSTLGNPHDHFKVAESNTVENDKYYPTNMQFKWKEFDIRNSRFTDVPDNTRLNEVGTITKYIATAVFPGVKNTKEIDRVNYTIYSPIQKAIPMTFNVKPNAPTISQPQFNGTAGTRPNVTVENLPTNAQLQNGANVTVELYQGTTKVATKTVTDRNGTTTLSAENFTANLAEGQQVYAVVKVSGGQGATAYSVSSDNSERRNVTGYNLVARDIINVKRGETISADELKRFIQVQEGNQRVDLPQGATVTATLDTNNISSGSEETKTVEATVNFGDNRTKKVRLTYKVLNTFPIANTIYDFKDVNRSNGHSDYYVNKGNNIPGGMNWLYKRSGGAEQRGTTFTGTLASDPVGTTNYTFIGRYNYGRFTNPTTTTGNLEHTQTLVHKVFDIADSKNVSVSQGTTLSAEQAKAAVKNAVGSDALPNGTTYEWVGNKVANTSGKQTFQVKVTLPPSQTGDNLPAATQATPSKTIDVTVNVTPPKPTFDSNKVTSTSRTITGTLGGLNANSRNTVVSVALNDGTNRVLTSENNGGVRINGNTWTATLPDDVKLRTSVAKNGETTQPTGLTVTTKIKGSTTADDISVVSDVKAVEMGDYSVNATIAGSKHIDVKVPHDAKRMELRFHNSTETSNTPKSIVLVRSQNGGDWQVDSTATPAGVTNVNNFVQAITNTVNASNKAENLVTITLKESYNNSKLRIKEENASGDNTATYRTGLGLRVDYKPETRQAVTSAGNWKVVSVTNNKPTLAYKGREASSVDARKVFPSGTSITKAMLENLVTVGDREDKVTNEADRPYGTPTVKIVSGLTETPGKATASGSYAVVLKAVDSQGKESAPLTVYVGVVSTAVSYQPKVDGAAKGQPIAIPVPTDKTHQGDEVSYTPKEITEGGKVYVPKTPGEKTVTITDNPQTIDVEYVEKPASSEVKYQPKVDGAAKGQPIAIPVPTDKTHQG
ncbi:YSIRK-type signal peptide-containing protein, partial [Streptococcus mitis]|uniref:YSIRK-type signal peptide-containing protein n=1 Tax=Streptococcus mitis TaxID=28037 RepID=UPI0021B5F095